MNKNKKAFTLIELLVVVAIIAILSSLFLSGFSQLKKNKNNNQPAPRPSVVFTNN